MHWVSCLMFRKFSLNPTNFNRKLTMMIKLDLKNNALTAVKIPVQNGLMQKVNIFCTENEHLHAFHAPTKIVQIGWGHHVNFCVWKKIGNYFWRRVYSNHRQQTWFVQCWSNVGTTVPTLGQRWTNHHCCLGYDNFMTLKKLFNRAFGQQSLNPKLTLQEILIFISMYWVSFLRNLGQSFPSK